MCAKYNTLAPTVLDQLTFQYFSHIHAKGRQFELYVKRSTLDHHWINFWGLQFSMLYTKFQGSQLLDSGVEDFNRFFYKIWTGQPLWSSRQNHLNRLSFSRPQEANYENKNKTGSVTFGKKSLEMWIHVSLIKRSEVILWILPFWDA